MSGPNGEPAVNVEHEEDDVPAEGKSQWTETQNTKCWRGSTGQAAAVEVGTLLQTEA